MNNFRAKVDSNEVSGAHNRKRQTHSSYCAARNCRNSRGSKRSDLSFFRFPNDPKRAKRWAINVQRDDLVQRSPEYLSKNCTVCSDHFEPIMFMNDLRNRLFGHAIPTIVSDSIPSKISSVSKTLLYPRSSSMYAVLENSEPVNSMTLKHDSGQNKDVEEMKPLHCDKYLKAAVAQTRDCAKTSLAVVIDRTSDSSPSTILTHKIAFMHEYKMSTFDKRRNDIMQGLPPGWRREETIRRRGMLTGKMDIFYYSPDGQRVTNKAQLARLTRLLGAKFDSASFDYQSGRPLSSNVHRRLRQDATLSLPIRQTASIFKQPVTIISNHPESKTRSDLRHGVQEQPRQLFWAKRLEGLFACDVNGEKLSTLQLPSAIQGVAPELITSENLLHSIAAALHLGNQPITGQTAPRSQLQRNLGVNISAEQPLIQAIMITDHDIKKQEMRVIEARRRLQHAVLSAENGDDDD